MTQRKAARAARAARGRPGRNARGRAVDVLAAPVVGWGFVADDGAVALPVEEAERAAFATPAADPEAAHNVVRLADRRPKGCC